MTQTRKLAYAGLLLSLSILIPWIFHATGIAGRIFLPMHIPVILCGFICGKKYGLLVGAAAPMLNILISGMPIVYPVGIGMVFELAAYGFFAGYIFDKTKKVIPSLLGAMIIGRIVRIAASYLITVPFGNVFLFKGILTALFVTSIWGIIVQVILIPVIMKAYQKLSRIS